MVGATDTASVMKYSDQYIIWNCTKWKYDDFKNIVFSLQRQTSVYLIVPQLEEETEFVAYLGAAFALKLLQLMHIMFVQVGNDLVSRMFLKYHSLITV